MSGNGEHSSHCPPHCSDSHNYSDHHSADYWGGPDPDWKGTSSSSQSSSCFIATAVYGDTMAPEVVSLRAFRDDVLKKTWWGRGFIVVYYKVSPPIAKALKKTPRIAAVIRAMLDQLVRRIS